MASSAPGGTLDVCRNFPRPRPLKDFLTEHLAAHEIVRVLPVAISVLKTYDPPLAALEGREVTAVRRSAGARPHRGALPGVR